MPAHLPWFHAVRERLTTTIEAKVVPPSSIERLALFVTGIIAAQSCVLAQVADELDTLELTAATQPDSVARRLRRTVCDSHLEASCCYEPVLPTVIDWEQLRETPSGYPGMVVLIVDESSKADQVHVLRTALAYRGSSLPLAWEVWEQNQAQEPGSYWQHMDAMLERVAALLPADLEVLVLADRAFDIPPFIDRITARGWHWMVRCKAKGTMRYLDQQGHEWALADLVRQQLARHARRWKARGRVFKDAGWREASVVAYQGSSYDDPLVVLTDLDPAWEVLDDYRRRFWIENRQPHCPHRTRWLFHGACQRLLSLAILAGLGGGRQRRVDTPGPMGLSSQRALMPLA
jgi:hypothetical protein